MARILILKNKLRSWLGQIDILDEDDKLAYRAVSEWSWTKSKMRLYRGDRELALLQRSWFSWTAQWQISSVLGDFVIERKQWSMTRLYTVKGGNYDGTVIEGSLWDRSFAIEGPQGTLACASNALMSLRDRHQVEILDEGAELLCVVAMVVIKAERNAEAAAAAAS